MTPASSPATTRPGRRLDRMAGVFVVLGLSLGALPAAGLAGHLPLASDRTPPALFELSQLAEALGRGELRFEVLAVGATTALLGGLVTSLAVGVLRQRRRSMHPSAPAPIESADDVLGSRTTLPWPAQDADAFLPEAPPDAFPPGLDEEEPPPFARYWSTVPVDAVQPETWAEHETTIEMPREASDRSPDATSDLEPEATPAASRSVLQSIPAWATGAGEAGPSDAAGDSTDAGADAPPGRGHTEQSAAAIASIESGLAPRADSPSARSALGTPDAPLVVELHDEREARARRPVGTNLPLVAVIGTVAVGMAFSAGAAVGAALGFGIGAAIGVAFAGGAGVAIGVTVALLGGGRR